MATWWGRRSERDSWQLSVAQPETGISRRRSVGDANGAQPRQSGDLAVGRAGASHTASRGANPGAVHTGVHEGQKESVRVILRCEANELSVDARPQVPRNRRRILCNTSWISWGRERCRCRQIVCRSRMALLGQTPCPDRIQGNRAGESGRVTSGFPRSFLRMRGENLLKGGSAVR